MTLVLIATSIIGAIAIPYGDPKFLDRALALEAAFIILVVLAWRGYSKIAFIVIPVSLMVIVANSISSSHVQIMVTFSKPLNAVILIIGGYILQSLLIVTAIQSIITERSRQIFKHRSI